MNIVRLSLANLRFHRLNSIFNVLVLALGIAMIVTLMRLGDQVRQRFEADLAGIDLVVGAKGSPLQLILSAVFHLDVPTGNIPLAEAETLLKNPLVKSAIPIALGDNYRGFRIVGTSVDYVAHYRAEPAAGALWTEPMQAVLGSEVARESGISVGAAFIGAHGLVSMEDQHTEFPYDVVGILKPTGTVLDRLVLTDVASVWNVHEHPDPDEPEEVAAAEAAGGTLPRELTALLIAYRSPLATATLPRLINSTTAMQAASPAFETARLMKLLGAGSEAVRLFAFVLMGIAALGFFVTLFNAVNDRRYDIVLMRSLGATRRKVLAFVLGEGLLLGCLGILLGLGLGYLFDAGARAWIAATRHMSLAPGGFGGGELLVAAGALLLGLLSALLPAIMAYRINVAETLSRGSP